MSSAEALYTFRDPYPDVLQWQRAQVLNAELYRDGALVEPTEAGSSFQLLKGSTVISNPTLTVASSRAQVTIPSADLPSTLALGEGYIEAWTLVLPDGTTRTYRREAAVARSFLYPVITDADLDAEYPDMARYLGTTITSWQRFIDESWKRLIHRLIREGVLSYLVMSATAFRDYHRESANELRFKWFVQKQGSDSRWADLMAYHQGKARDEWKAMNWVYDADHDGVPDSAERRNAGAVVHRNPSPRRYLAKSGWW